MHASQYPVKVKRKVKNAQGSPKLALCLFLSFTQKLIVYFCAHVMKFFSHLVKLPPKEKEWTEFRALVSFFFSYPLMSILAVSSGLVLLEITLQQQLVNSSFFSATYTERKLRQVKPLEFDERREKITADCCIPFACLACTCLEFGSVACHIASRSSFAFLMSFSHFCVARTTRQRSENVTQ